MLKYFFLFLALFLTTATFADELNSPPIILEIILSFKPLYAASCLALLLVCLINRKFLYSFLFALLFLFNYSKIHPWYQPEIRTIGLQKQKVKLAIVNVLYGNTDYKRTIDFLRDERPNIVLFIELEKNWFEELNKLNDILPYDAPNDPKSIFEVKLKSNLKIEEFNIFPLDDPIRKTMSVILSINNKKVFILIPHLPTPTDPDRFALRNKQINTLAEIVSKQNLPTIVIGDFNTSIWSPYYKKFIDKTNLENSRKHFGILPTWYAISTSIPLVAAPIDQILFSKEFSTSNSYLGKDIGSDHLPLISELEF